MSQCFCFSLKPIFAIDPAAPQKLAHFHCGQRNSDIDHLNNITTLEFKKNTNRRVKFDIVMELSQTSIYFKVICLYVDSEYYIIKLWVVHK